MSHASALPLHICFMARPVAIAPARLTPFLGILASEGSAMPA